MNHLPLINEFEEHSTMLNVTLVSAEDLHGRLIAALRNNELEIAESMIIAIELNKSTEQITFYKNLENIKNNKLNYFNKIIDLP